MGTRHRRLTLAAVLITAAVLATACDGGNPPDPPVRLDQLQVLATHNSFHIEPPQALLDAIEPLDAGLVDSIEYSHASLRDQLDLGIRGLELDAFADPDGGRYASPKAVDVLGLPAPGPEMSDPGFKVFHMQELDYGSTCPTLVGCLEEVRAWSAAHPDHVPITIQIEAKDGVVADPLGLGFVQPLPIGRAALRTLEGRDPIRLRRRPADPPRRRSG